MITIYQFPPLWGLPNASPFCMKLEVYCRLAGLQYQVKNIGDPRRAPKGKAPFIIDGDVKIADSSFIIDYFKQKYGDPLDGHLNDTRRAVGLALQRLMEEHLYWTALYSRWIDDKNWPKVKETFFARVPTLLKSFVAKRVRANMKAALHGQGIGRHSPDEIYVLGLQDLKALKVILTEQPYLLGDIPTSVDATGYAFIANIIEVPIDSPLKSYALSQASFIDYCQRMKELCKF